MFHVVKISGVSVIEEAEMMTLSQAAEYLKVSRRKLHRLMQAGELDAFISPLDRREKLVKREDLDQLKTTLVPVQPRSTSG